MYDLALGKLSGVYVEMITNGDLESLVRDRLNAVVDPYSGRSVVEGRTLSSVDQEGETLRVRLRLGYPARTSAIALTAEIKSVLVDIQGITTVDVAIDSDIISHAVQKGAQQLDGVKNIIAVASGKGGVGKSTISVNIALALVAEGARTGILDADIYGPSQPKMLGISGRPEVVDGKGMRPQENHGVQAMSIGFMIDEETPMIWRGPMVSQALDQMLNETLWDDLDYLIVDLPPGTGDIQLSLSQRVPVAGAIIVTTPQDIALLDARKAFKMFEKVEVPILGVVENMSTHICSQCGHEQHIFGEGGGTRMAAEYDLPYLGDIPLDINIRVQADGGNPTVASDPDGEIARRYIDIALRATGYLSIRKKDYSDRFPSIVIENS